MYIQGGEIDREKIIQLDWNQGKHFFQGKKRFKPKRKYDLGFYFITFFYHHMCPSILNKETISKLDEVSLMSTLLLRNFINKIKCLVIWEKKKNKDRDYCIS